MLHRQAVRGYVTLNTLVFTDELARLEEHVRTFGGCRCRRGAVVQDLGVANLLRELCPQLGSPCQYANDSYIGSVGAHGAETRCAPRRLGS